MPYTARGKCRIMANISLAKNCYIIKKYFSLDKNLNRLERGGGAVILPDRNGKLLQEALN